MQAAAHVYRQAARTITAVSTVYSGLVLPSTVSIIL